jgi:NAD(P)-dependent dehydrogenase (short-subunit alcohol dehydrogenase family)
MQRIFITGGASGLGRALAGRYAAAGWRVCIADLNEARGEAAVRELTGAADVLFTRCDVRCEQDLQAAAEALQARWGGVDVVVNNAGVAQAGAIEDVSLEDWQWILDINLLGVVRGAKVFTPLFKHQGHGHFINVASMAGLLDVPMMSSYNATKAAVVSLSETLQHELKDSGIGVTLVCPAFFKTNLGESLRTSSPAFRHTMDKLMASGRISAEEIAEQVFQAQQRGRFHCLPHADARWLWLLKRLLPRAAYARIIQRGTRRLRQRHEEAAR